MCSETELFPKDEQIRKLQNEEMFLENTTVRCNNPDCYEIYQTSYLLDYMKKNNVLCKIKDEAWELMKRYPINIEEIPFIFRKQGTRNTNEDGYTLTELLIVITVVCLIFIILLIEL